MNLQEITVALKAGDLTVEEASTLIGSLEPSRERKCSAKLTNGKSKATMFLIQNIPGLTSFGLSLFAEAAETLFGTSDEATETQEWLRAEYAKVADKLTRKPEKKAKKS